MQETIPEELHLCVLHELACIGLSDAFLDDLTISKIVSVEGLRCLREEGNNSGALVLGELLEAGFDFGRQFEDHGRRLDPRERGVNSQLRFEPRSQRIEA